MTFEEMRRVLASRFFARGRFWRAKALDLGAHPDTCLKRAEEAEDCARIAADLNESYVAPSEPDMKNAAASRRTP